jgi:hypothetical protein
MVGHRGWRKCGWLPLFALGLTRTASAQSTGSTAAPSVALDVQPASASVYLHPANDAEVGSLSCTGPCTRELAAGTYHVEAGFSTMNLAQADKEIVIREGRQRVRVIIDERPLRRMLGGILLVGGLVALSTSAIWTGVDRGLSARPEGTELWIGLAGVGTTAGGIGLLFAYFKPSVTVAF